MSAPGASWGEMPGFPVPRRSGRDLKKPLIDAPYSRPANQSHDTPISGCVGGDNTGPVFADSTGQRRRLMRMLGAGGSVLLLGAVILVGIGLSGGPDTPFTVFGAPATHRHADGRPAPGSASSPPTGTPITPARSRAPSPTKSADPSPAPSPTSSPAPTNRAGKTPPGHSRSQNPHPSPSWHGR
jgi:hypothetical protein